MHEIFITKMNSICTSFRIKSAFNSEAHSMVPASNLAGSGDIHGASYTKTPSDETPKTVENPAQWRSVA